MNLLDQQHDFSVFRSVHVAGSNALFHFLTMETIYAVNFMPLGNRAYYLCREPAISICFPGCGDTFLVGCP